MTKRIIILLILCSSAYGWTGMKPMLGEQVDWSHPLAPKAGIWFFNEGSGDTVQDLSGNGHTGTLSGMDWTAAKFGSGILGDAVDDYCKVAEDHLGNGFLDNLTEVTIVVWVYINDATTDSDLFVVGQHAGGEPFVLWFDNAAPDHWGYLATDNNDDTTGVLYSNHIPVANTWYQVALVFKGGVNTRLYINGIEDLGGDFPAAHAAVGEIKAGFDHTIGNDDQSIAKGVRGIIDNVSVYNRALTASEVSQLYYDSFCFMAEQLDITMQYTYAAAPPTGGQVIMIQMSAVTLGMVLAAGSLVWLNRRAA